MDNSEYTRLSRIITEKIIKKLGIDEKDLVYEKKPKTVVLITPDFFPRMSNNIAYTTKEIAQNLAAKNINVHLIAYDPLKAGTTDELAGFRVHYVSNPVRAYSPLTWTLTLSMEISRIIADIFHNEGNIDLIHAHEWLTFPAGIHLQAALRKPLLVNYYSIEHMRSPGICNGYTEAVKQIEWMGSYESKRILVNESWLKEKLQWYYSTPPEKVNVLRPEDEEFDRKLVRDYSWVLKQWKELMER